MRRYVAKRVLSLVPTMLLATIVVFGLIQLVPGDVALAIAGESATDERLAQIRDELHLNDSTASQYGRWLTSAIGGDLGESLVTREPVSDSIGRRLPATLHIVFAAAALALLLGFPAGVFAASRAGTRADASVSSLATLGIAIPNFWLGMVLVTVFSLNLGWFPSVGFVSIFDEPGAALEHLVLPAIALGVAGGAEVARQVRSTMVEVLAADAMRTHEAKGLSRRSIVWKHAMRNAGVPIATVVGLLVTRLLSATVVVEAVFGIPGLGSMVIQAAQQRDFPVIQGVILVMILIVVLTNALVDVSYKIIDPRIKF